MILPHIAKAILKLGGWTLVGKAPEIRKVVFIVAPHTSNWDGFWALVAKVALRLDVHFFGKDSLFWFPLNILLKGLGGIPLNRSEAGPAVQQAIDWFDAEDRFHFALAPEGTRSKTKGWKTGFYRIADGANVPIFLAFLDYRDKRRLTVSFIGKTQPASAGFLLPARLPWR